LSRGGENAPSQTHPSRYRTDQLLQLHYRADHPADTSALENGQEALLLAAKVSQTFVSPPSLFDIT
jgi:hypothetical protein